MHDQLKTEVSLILSFDLLHLFSFIQCAHYLSSHWLILEITAPSNYCFGSADDTYLQLDCSGYLIKPRPMIVDIFNIF